jgi:hypothetical protein
MAKSKFTDDEIYALIDEGKTNAQISRAMGMTQGSVNTRINRLRAQGEKAKEGSKQTEPKPEKPVELTGTPFPFDRNEQIMYDGKLHIVNSIGKDRMIIRENATLTPKTLTTDDFERNKSLFKKLKSKSENQYENIARNRPDEEPEKSVETLFKPEPSPDQKTKFEKLVERMREEAVTRKPATINPVFEAAVQDMVAQNEAKKEPIKLDPEMESSVDPVSPFPKEPEGYIDPEWMCKPIPHKGTLEYRIWQKAYNEIKAYHEAKADVEKALLSGGRLPATVTDKYNRIVSKYGEEAGA